MDGEEHLSFLAAKSGEGSRLFSDLDLESVNDWSRLLLSNLEPAVSLKSIFSLTTDLNRCLLLGRSSGLDLAALVRRLFLIFVGSEISGFTFSSTSKCFFRFPPLSAIVCFVSHSFDFMFQRNTDLKIKKQFQFQFNQNKIKERILNLPISFYFSSIRISFNTDRWERIVLHWYKKDFWSSTESRTQRKSEESKKSCLKSHFPLGQYKIQ